MRSHLISFAAVRVVQPAAVLSLFIFTSQSLLLSHTLSIYRIYIYKLMYEYLSRSCHVP